MNKYLFVRDHFAVVLMDFSHSGDILLRIIMDYRLHLK